MTTRWHRLRTWRRLVEVAQAATVLGLPFVKVRGESALRLDVSTLTLHAFGARVGLDELLVVLAASLFLLFAFLLATLLFGRLWCGWGCPQTALLDLTGLFERARRAGGWRRGAAWLGLAAASALVAANLLWYLVPPADFFARLASLTLGPALGPAWLVLAVAVFADLALWRHRFCATTCPYAKLQGALLDRHSLAIAYDRRRDADCIDCGACVRVCPVGIDIRDGLQAACVACGACVDACAPIMGKLRRAPRLVGHFFGEPGTRARLLRPAALALAALTAGSFALTAAVAAERSPLEATVTGAGDLAPRRAPSGEVWSVFTLALQNRGREPLALRLGATARGAELALRPDAIQLAPGQHERVQVRVVARGLGPEARQLDAELSVAPVPGAPARSAPPLTRRLVLDVPEARR
ncbi:MAG TPA: 4Fe-4S dicluster domain-containing protein [Anaeromyxobacteraceae bacterium]